MSYNKKITIADIAETLGVSKTTVSRAISGKGRIGNETRKKVLDYIEEHNYRPNLVAQGLAQSKTFNIGITMPGEYEIMDLPFFENCMVGIYDMASQMGYDVILDFNNNTDISHLERIVNYHKVDGIILLRTYIEDKAIQFLKEKKIPFVAIGTTPDEAVYQIDHNHKEACQELISILLMKQMKHMALIGGNEKLIVNQSRYDGFVNAFQSLNLPVDDRLIFMNHEKSVRIEKALDQILEQKVDCIVCMDDSICSIVLRELAKRKIRVPEDMKVASFYNSTILENHDPSITSLSFGVQELGMQAAKVLEDLMEEREAEKKTLLGYEVVLKESTQ